MKIYGIEFFDSDWGDYGLSSLEDESRWWADKALVEQMVEEKNQQIIDRRNNEVRKEYINAHKRWETNERRAKILLKSGERIPTWPEPQEPTYVTEIGRWWSCFSVVEADVLDLT